MTERAKSISAKQLSAEVQTAVQKATANHQLLGGVKLDPGFVLHPGLIWGFILRKDLSKIPLGELQGLAGEVLKATPSASGATPAALIHGKEIIVGFLPELQVSAFHE
jgi:hypothetical protein